MMTKIPVSSEGGVLIKYLEEISFYQPLPSDKERELAERIQRGDIEARNELVQANLRFVISIAKQYQHQGLALTDLISEGVLGLIKAAEKFDGSKGFKFISYAVWWIRQSILKSLAEKGRIVRMPQNRVLDLHRILKLSQSLEQEKGHRVNFADVARILDMPLESVEETIRRGRRHRSLDVVIGDGDPDENLRFSDFIDDESQPSPEKDAVKASLRDEIESVLVSLDSREAEIIRLYFGLGQKYPLTLGEIGQRYGLTRERIRQIREKALEHLRCRSRSQRLEPYYEA